MTYQWKTGFFKADPNVAAGVMAKLSAENNLTASSLVDVSRPEDAPLHDDFEWNDDVAAELYRQDQARSMIRSIVVVSEDSPKQETTRAYVIVQPETHNYEPIQMVVKDEDKLQLLYKQAKRELDSFKTKYAGIKAFADLFKAIDALPERTEE